MQLLYRTGKQLPTRDTDCKIFSAMLSHCTAAYYDAITGPTEFIITTYSLSIANVAQSRKKNDLLQDFASRGSQMLLWFQWIVNTNYFDSIRMALFPLIIIIPLKTISQLLYVMLEIIISRQNSQGARIIQGTPGRL